jgi:hypothetical protein
MEPTGGLVALTGTVTRLLVQLGGAALTVVLAWQCLKVLLRGGDERALRELAVRVLALGLVVAAMGNLAGTAALVQAVGAALWGGIVEAVRTGL